jgi:hypothetical protein
MKHPPNISKAGAWGIEKVNGNNKEIPIPPFSPGIHPKAIPKRHPNVAAKMVFNPNSDAITS